MSTDWTRWRSDSEFLGCELPNGIVCRALATPASTSCAVSCFAAGGSIAEWPTVGSGTAHLLEHVIGTRTIEIARHRGAAVLLNAATSRERTTFSWRTSTRDLAASIHSWFEAQRPDPTWWSELDAQRRVVVDELRLKAESPIRRLRERFVEHLFTNHPIRSPVGGEASRVAEAPDSLVTDYLGRWYSGANLALVVAGPFDLDDLRRTLEDAASQLARGSRFRLPREAGEPDVMARGELVLAAPGDGPELTEVGFVAADASHEDAPALDALCVELQTARGPGSLRHRLARDGIASDLVARYVATRYGVGFMSILTEHEPGASEAVRVSIEAWCASVAQGRRIVDPTTARQWVEATRRSARSLDERLQRVGVEALHPDAPTDVRDGWRRILSVSPEQIASSVARWTGSDRWAWGVVRRDRGPSHQRRRSRVGELAPITAPHPVEALPRTVPVPIRRSSASAADRPAPWMRRLENGVRLVGFPTLSELSTALVLWRGGIFADSESQRGCCHLMAGLLASCHSDREDLADPGLHAFCDADFWGVSWTGAADRMVDGLDAFVRSATRPTFPSDAFEAYRRAMLAALDEPPATWEAAALKRLRRRLLAGHPYASDVAGSPSTLARLRVDDVQRCHDELSCGANTVVVVTGRAACAALPRDVVRRLAALPPGACLPASTQTEPESPTVAVVSSPRFGGWIATGCSGCSWTRPDKLAMDLLRSVLVGPDGSQSGGLLTRALRRRGLAYGLHCHHQPGFGTGTFGIAAAAALDTHSTVLGVVQDTMSRIASGELAPREVELAGKIRRLRHALLDESPRRQAYVVGRHVHACGDLASWRSLPERIEALAPTDVAAAARRLVPSDSDAARRSEVTGRGPDRRDRPVLVGP